MLTLHNLVTLLNTEQSVRRYITTYAKNNPIRSGAKVVKANGRDSTKVVDDWIIGLRCEWSLIETPHAYTFVRFFPSDRTTFFGVNFTIRVEDANGVCHYRHCTQLLGDIRDRKLVQSTMHVEPHITVFILMDEVEEQLSAFRKLQREYDTAKHALGPIAQFV